MPAVPIATSPLASHLHAPGLWPLAAAALRHLTRLPPTARQRWAGQPLGQIVITPHERPRYEPGTLLWREMAGHAVLVFTPAVVTTDRIAFWAIVGAWLDHWLGCNATEAPWLSEGGAPGQPAAIARAAADLQAILARGYAAAALGIAQPRALFARALALAMTEPPALFSADPPLARWLGRTLLSENWWRQLGDYPTPRAEATT